MALRSTRALSARLQWRRGTQIGALVQDLGDTRCHHTYILRYNEDRLRHWFHYHPEASAVQVPVPAAASRHMRNLRARKFQWRRRACEIRWYQCHLLDSTKWMIYILTT